MSGLQAITFARHGDKKWQRYQNYNFAGTDAVVGLIAPELPSAMMSMAVAFVHSSEGYAPVALLNLMVGKNLFVANDGKWLANYVPLGYLNYPFRLGKNANNEHLLCVDEDSGLVNTDEQGEAFYVSKGVPTEQIKIIMNSLLQIEKGNEKTREICRILESHDLIVPWHIQMPDGTETNAISGLFRIDELKLNTLEAAALVELRNVGALMVAYGQLFSMQHFRSLNKMLTHSNVTTPSRPGNTLEFTISADSGTLNFDNLRQGAFE